MRHALINYARDRRRSEARSGVLQRSRRHGDAPSYTVNRCRSSTPKRSVPTDEGPAEVNDALGRLATLNRAWRRSSAVPRFFCRLRRRGKPRSSGPDGPHRPRDWIKRATLWLRRELAQSGKRERAVKTGHLPRSDTIQLCSVAGQDRRLMFCQHRQQRRGILNRGGRLAAGKRSGRLGRASRLRVTAALVARSGAGSRARAHRHGAPGTARAALESTASITPVLRECVAGPPAIEAIRLQPRSRASLSVGVRVGVYSIVRTHWPRRHGRGLPARSGADGQFAQTAPAQNCAGAAPLLIDRFNAERRIWRQLDHPGIATTVRRRITADGRTVYGHGVCRGGDTSRWVLCAQGHAAKSG